MHVQIYKTLWNLLYVYGILRSFLLGCFAGIMFVKCLLIKMITGLTFSSVLKNHQNSLKPIHFCCVVRSGNQGIYIQGPIEGCIYTGPRQGYYILKGFLRDIIYVYIYIPPPEGSVDYKSLLALYERLRSCLGIHL